MSARQVATISIPTRHGHFIFERYADGDVIVSLGGSHWFELDAKAQTVIVDFLSGTKSKGVNRESLSGTLKHEAMLAKSLKSKPGMDLNQKKVRKEPDGWGATVEDGKRYFYKTRDQARAASSQHAVGIGGRIA